MTDPSTAPFVSVVVPVRNEARHLRDCLAALLDQDYPAERREILVVDGRSTDGTREIVSALAPAHPHLALLDNPAGLIPHGLNVGICAARGSIVVRVNGHAVVDRGYVSACVRALEATGADNVGGLMRWKGIGFWGEVIALALASPFARPSPFYRSAAACEVDTVCLGAFRRDTLKQVGLFDESLPWNEDFELNYRIRRAGGRIHYTPEIQATYYTRGSLPALARQFWNYGRGKGLVVKRNPGSVSPRHLAAPSLVLALLGGVGLVGIGRPAPLLALLILYGGASAFFARRAAPRAPIRVWAAVALSFVCMHVSWGASVIAELAGLFAPAPRRRGVARWAGV